MAVPVCMTSGARGVAEAVNSASCGGINLLCENKDLTSYPSRSVEKFQNVY